MLLGLMAGKWNYKVYDYFTKLKGANYNTFEDEMRGFFSKDKTGDIHLSIISKHWLTLCLFWKPLICVRIVRCFTYYKLI